MKDIPFVATTAVVHSVLCCAQSFFNGGCRWVATLRLSKLTQEPPLIVSLLYWLLCRSSGLNRHDPSLHRRLLLRSATPGKRPMGWHARMMARFEEDRHQNMQGYDCTAGTTPSPAGSVSQRSLDSLPRAHGDILEENDDMCAVCGQDGELLLCDGCPRAFHMACVGLQSLPQGMITCLAGQHQLADPDDKFEATNAFGYDISHMSGGD